MNINETVYTNEDLKRLEGIIKNVKDPSARKKLTHLQNDLKRKIKKHQKGLQNRNRSLRTFYWVVTPFVLLFVVVGAYYFMKKGKVTKEYA